jgi:phosphopantetheine adenylyltransferase
MAASSLGVGVLPLVLDASTTACPTGLVAAAAREVQPSGRLYVYCHPGAESQPASMTQTMRFATLAFDAISRVAPCLDVRLLFTAAGWDDNAVAALPFDAVLVSQPADGPMAQQLSGRDPARQHKVAVTSEAVTRLADAVPSVATPRGALVAHGPRASLMALAADVLSGPSPPHATAVVAGTFDRLHAGHRLLLSCAALVCTGTLYVGVTGDRLTARKQLTHLMQPLAERQAAVRAFLADAHPGLRVVVGELTDPLRGIDGQPPVDGLVVSRETVGNAVRLNLVKYVAWLLALLFPPARKALYAKFQGVKPYGLVVAELLPLRSRESTKLSSTLLRRQEEAEAKRS